MDSTPNPEVTARDLHPALNAVGKVTALILELEDDLVQIPAGKELVRRAKAAHDALLAE